MGFDRQSKTIRKNKFLRKKRKKADIQILIASIFAFSLPNSII